MTRIGTCEFPEVSDEWQFKSVRTTRKLKPHEQVQDHWKKRDSEFITEEQYSRSKYRLGKQGYKQNTKSKNCQRGTVPDTCSDENGKSEPDHLKQHINSSPLNEERSEELLSEDLQEVKSRDEFVSQKLGKLGKRPKKPSGICKKDAELHITYKERLRERKNVKYDEMFHTTSGKENDPVDKEDLDIFHMLKTVLTQKRNSMRKKTQILIQIQKMR